MSPNSFRLVNKPLLRNNNRVFFVNQGFVFTLITVLTLYLNATSDAFPLFSHITESTDEQIEKKNAAFIQAIYFKFQTRTEL